MTGATGHRVNAKKEVRWIGTLKEWEESGQPVTVFCQQRGLRTGQFFWWRRTLRQRGKWQPRMKGVSGDLIGSKPPVSFASVEVVESDEVDITKPSPFHVESLELLVGSSYRIVLPDGFDKQNLERLLDVLEARRC